LAIPLKRFERGPVQFLSEEETTALLKAPDTTTWLGRRDQLLLQVALQTGLRNSELIRLCRQDVELGTGANIKCLGKGRKTRCTPLKSDLAARLSGWIAEQPPGPTTPVFATAKGRAMSSDAFQRLVTRHIKTAGKTCVSLQKRRVTPHTLRHSLAMNLLQRGVDITVIALWLGHESIETTQSYLHADMALKEKALARIANTKTIPKRYRPNDQLLAFLESL
jgi:integrase/recombinase XerD